MTTIINGSSPSITFSDGSAQTSATRPFLNRIINGAMVIDQRNAGASVTPTDNQYTLDRWKTQASQTSKLTIQQNAGSVTPPAGFTNYLGVTSSSAYSVLTGDYFAVDQRIEGFNTADLNFGSANAKTFTLSFWVRSSLTGTFGGSFTNGAYNRSYPFTYTISAANTWEQKTVTVAGDTSGTWVGATNGIGLYVQFGLGVGSTYSGTAGAWTGSGLVSATGATSVVGTNGATFYITGVQLEVGSTATSFDYRPYGTELQLCQRYLPAFTPNGSTGLVGQGQMWNNTTTFYTYFTFQTTTRVPPTGITVSSLSHFKGNGVSTDVTSLSAITVDATTVNGATIRGVGSGGTANQQTSLIAISSSAQLLLTGCEL
jgi:hypothetical protein